MIRRVLAAFAVVISFALAGLTPAAPAQAVYAGTCATNSFCLYPWTGYGAPAAGDRWQTSYNNVINYHGGCINIGSATWDNGTPVADNSASLMFNTGSGSTYAGYYIRVFNWANCNGGGGSKGLGYAGSNGYIYQLSNLDSYYYTDPQVGPYKLYHTITSIQIRNPLD